VRSFDYYDFLFSDCLGTGGSFIFGLYFYPFLSNIRELIILENNQRTLGHPTFLRTMLGKMEIKGGLIDPGLTPSSLSLPPHPQINLEPKT
jgi:hypothetical protein